MKSVRFTLRQLEYFLVIAESPSLSSAAVRLHVSQPALSQALKELERALETQLVLRERAKGVTLTPSGKQVLAQARQLVRLASEIQEENADGDTLRGSLAVGCYTSLAPTALPALLAGFSALHPHLDLQFNEDNQDVVQQRLLDGELDVAILYDMALWPEMTRVPLLSVRPHVLLPQEHPLSGDDAVWLRDLAAEPMVLLDAPPSAHNTLEVFRRLGITPVVQHRPKSFELARSLVGRGMGYAFMVQRLATSHTYEGLPVVVKEIAEPVADASILLVWPSSTRPSRRALRFAEYCVDHFTRLARRIPIGAAAREPLDPDPPHRTLGSAP